MRRVGFLVNPIAGMGGRVGLKGTDGVVDEARRRGGRSFAQERAVQSLEIFATNPAHHDVRWFTCGGAMGEHALRATGFSDDAIEIVRPTPATTSAEDTIDASRAFLRAKVDLILFCGGDGTCRDILSAVGSEVPVLGIPAGVKMHSGVFGVLPIGTAAILARWVRGDLPVGESEVLDLDEERYRKGEWSVRLFGTARTPQEPSLLQAGKMMVQEVSDEALHEELAMHVSDLFEEEPETLFLLGPGSTLAGIARRLDLPKTLLGIDAYVAGERVGEDVNERNILDLLSTRTTAKLIVSPIGAQGFILGRGNLQLSPAVVRRIGPANTIVVATPAKLDRTPVLRVDSGDADVDRLYAAKPYFFVVVGYRTSRLHPLQSWSPDVPLQN